MASGLSYKIISAVGEESSKGNDALEQLERIVKEHMQEGRWPVGGIAISAVVGPKIAGSAKDNWFMRAAQALVRKVME